VSAELGTQKAAEPKGGMTVISVVTIMCVAVLPFRLFAQDSPKSGEHFSRSFTHQ